MICYLARHGKDDDTVRGGWSMSPLVEAGVSQANRLAEEIDIRNDKLQIKKIFASDLPRARQTAQIVADKIGLEVTLLPEFRETNNGVFAGMKHEIANEKHPGFFWNTLEWDECYPEGESPKIFYERIYEAWEEFSKTIAKENENVLLISHSGVMHAINCIVNGEKFTNKEKHRRFEFCTLLPMKFEKEKWIWENDL